MDIVTQAKNIGSVLGTASVIAYISGYLALRARAHALGTDPGFKLVDEAYVFAGFRFLFITLVVLLLSAPVILLTRWGVLWLARYVPVKTSQHLQWLLLVVLAIMTIMTFKILSVSGVLLQQPVFETLGSTLQRAILGKETAVSLLLTFSTVVLVTLSALWLYTRISTGTDPLGWILLIVVALQIIMLPIYHGALFADRKVRILAAIPDTVNGLTAPLGIVDRTSEHVTLLGLDLEGNRRLATVKFEDLNGIPIKQIISLKDFIGNALAGDPNGEPSGSGGWAMEPAMQAVDANGQTTEEQAIEEQAIEEQAIEKQAIEEQAMTSQESEVNRGFFAVLADYLQITFEAIGSLGDSVVESGELWVAELDASGAASEPKRIGALDDLAWPVVRPDGSTFYALQRGRVVRLGKDGEMAEAFELTLQWRKLLGVAEDGTVVGLVRDGGETKPAMLTPNGGIRVSPSPLSDEDKAAVSHLLQEARSYVGTRTLSVERSVRGGRGFDVFLKTGDKVVNLSDCGDDSCGHASLAADFNMALFIRQPRY